MSSRREGLASILAGIVLLTPAAGSSPSPEGAESPDAVAARIQGLTPARWAEAVPVVHPDDRAAWGARLLMLVQVALESADPSGTGAASADLGPILQKHGLAPTYEEMRTWRRESEMSEEALAQKMGASLAGKDLQAILRDLGALLESIALEKDRPVLPGGELEGLRVEGDVAYATAHGVDLVFGRRAGRWYWRPLQ